MQVYLVQHAEAKREEEDPQRPLTERGWQEIRRVAAFIARAGCVQVARIIHSGKTRAQQTAEVLAEYLCPSAGVSAAEALEPLAAPQLWAARLATAQEPVMLVGHLPHLGRLVALLLCGEEGRQPVTLQMAGVVCLARAESAAWSLQWMIIPALLAEAS